MGIIRRTLAGAALCCLAVAISGCTPGSTGGQAVSTHSASASVLPPVPDTSPAAPTGRPASGTLATSGTLAPQPVGAGGSPAQALQQAFVSVSSAVLPSVVEIRTSVGLGSGIVYDTAGHIVTNHHVVGTATSFTVRLSDGHSYPAKLTGGYTPDDLAVIQISGVKGLRPARFGDSSTLQIGDLVLAVGNPLGLDGSVTEGIVSAIGRTMTEPAGDGSPGATLPNTIQTSAAINPGNSGGALVDLAGDVVGIPTLAATDQQEGGAAPGIGFAIPSNVVTNIAKQIISFGSVHNSHRAALGVEVTTVYDQQTGAPGGVGIVNVTPGGGADAAGVTVGDVVVSVNGTKTPTSAVLSEVLAQLQPGQKVTLGVVTSAAAKKTITLTLGQLPG